MRGRRPGDLVPRLTVAVGLVLAATATARVPALAAQPVEIGASALPVPFVPQPPALCGAAAAAMVQRYWDGGRHYPAGFAHLLEADGSGIATDVLQGALSARGHDLRDLTGDGAGVRHAVRSGIPVIALIREPGGAPYHYVVIVGWSDGEVAVHDPAWGPGRTFDPETWHRIWSRGSTWALAVGPAPTSTSSAEPPTADGPTATASGSPVDRALIEADRALRTGAYTEAESWAVEARRRGATPESVQERIALSRYLGDDDTGALEAWNELGRPEVDLVEVEGLRTSRYAPFADFMGLEPRSTLTAGGLALARRRAASYPGARASRIGYEIRNDGAAKVRGAVVEVAPPGPADLLVEAGSFLATRRAEVHGSGPFDGGGRVSAEIDLSPLPSWSARFRLPVGGSAVTAAVGRDWLDRDGLSPGDVPGNARTRGTFTVDRWIHPHLHTSLGAMAARYDDDARTLGLTASVGVASTGDRLTGRLWMEGHTGGRRYARAGVTATASTSWRDGAWSGRIEAGGAAASPGTPRVDRFTLAGPRWGGRSADGLLGPRSSREMARASLGRGTAVVRLEVVRWLDAAGGHIGVGGIGEGARVGALDELEGPESPTSWAAGIGLRLRGFESSTLRVDLLRTDRGVFRLGAGWQIGPAAWGRH